ncbi:type I DNA topoisomerase [Dichotomicrobium thermohalophilum]|uniref:DNA topoisomerase 1 n=1 Tax=Dichotomicrobium thermohalophilum TaxID=933063 RepID=A0A397PFG7_9HYPH|nr:type I DNA topoisomerase [Dichotomicrobium thermohalophilum]RIA47762.1 DNA topoisomerase-1 [Dichotomicrobium thermohalophilum]
MNIVIVESAAKAKTINKYLGRDYKVLASYGHVSDLPAKDGSVEPEKDFEMHWRVSPDSTKVIREIVNEVKKADRLILATDPDREGEAISWHLLRILEEKKALKGVKVQRVAFNAVTKDAVRQALEQPRDIDSPLVEAYLARRALDYLVGFTLSPVLWRKLPGARSAGRVQSVALRLVCDRELEIESFKSQEYWTINARLANATGEDFTAKLQARDGKKLGKFDIPNEEAAKAIRDAVTGGSFKVLSIERKSTKRNPAPPFTTSTLQQEASRKLRYSPRQTMQIAQKLYEGVDLGGETVGLITYMRTDGVQIAPEALSQCRDVIGGDFGRKYLPDSPRHYKTKAKNAQEAHEAVRPTDYRRAPDDIKRYLKDDEYKLYKLIWQRAVASQMASAEVDRTTVDIDTDGKDGTRYTFRATGQVITFDGFLKLYEEGRDDAADEDSARLPPLMENETVKAKAIEPRQHFTEPPPRFTEATLIKKLEELGIGRPSTYASTMNVLRERDYVRLEKNRLVPEDRGRLVTAFLESFFQRYVEYDFTADLEEKLDRISNGELSWKQVLRDFWREFIGAVDEIKHLRVSEVLEALNEILGPHIFPDPGDGTDPRKCPSCEDGRLSLKVGKFGAFIGCSNYPECRYTRQLGRPGEDGEEGATPDKIELGHDPETGEPVTLRSGRFGPYVQLGEAQNGEKPKRASVPKGMDPAVVTLDMALKLLSLPREVGPHPETGKLIMAGIGRYGPFVEHAGKYANLESADEVFTVGLNRAVSLLAEAKTRRPRGGTVLKDLGEHPELGGPIQVCDGRYGPYVKHGKINATLPKDTDPSEVSVEKAVELIAAKAEKSGKKPAKAKSGGKSGSKTKTAAKTAKKPATKTESSGDDAASKSKGKAAKSANGARTKPKSASAKSGGKTSSGKKARDSAPDSAR